MVGRVTSEPRDSSVTSLIGCPSEVTEPPKASVLGRESNVSLKWSVLFQIDYIFRTSLFMLTLFMVHTMNENYLKHLSTGERSLEALMFREHIPGNLKSHTHTLCQG